MAELIRIAMWSGPRNISTAMMRAWGQRADTVVTDEPLYAHYLKATGIDHPGRAEVIAHHETDWRTVVTWITGPAVPAPPVGDGRRKTASGCGCPGAAPAIWYQKHMTHHLLPEMDRAWLGKLTHAFLIRDPREMLLSLVKNLPRPTIRDTGLPQQAEIFDQVSLSGGPAPAPPIIDARDVLEGPRRMLTLLCAALGVSFDEAMLFWPPGPRATDGIWAKHWYHNVERSTGFEPYRSRHETIPRELQPLLKECMSYYDRLHALRLR